MKQQIHLYGEGQPTPIAIDLHEGATVLELIIAAQKAGALPAGAAPTEFVAFILDVEEPVAHDRPVHDPKSGSHRHPIHCHRCREIGVAVTFNGLKHERAFAPSTHVSRVLHWAVHKFGLTGQDAANKELRLGSATGQILQNEAPIGSYAVHPHCSLFLFLTDIVQVNG